MIDFLLPAFHKYHHKATCMLDGSFSCKTRRDLESPLKGARPRDQAKPKHVLPKERSLEGMDDPSPSNDRPV